MAKTGFLFLCILGVNSFLHAQNLTTDSIPIRKGLEGTEEFDMNKAINKAIEEDRPVFPFGLKNIEPLTLDTELLLRWDMPDSLRIQKVDPLLLPPGVFSLYILYMDKLDSILFCTACILSEWEREVLRQLTPGGRDFNHGLSMIFSPSYRRRVHNAKYATAYKNFITSPSVKLTERDRIQLRKSVNNLKANPVSVSVSVKKSGPFD